MYVYSEVRLRNVVANQHQGFILSAGGPGIPSPSHNFPYPEILSRVIIFAIFMSLNVSQYVPSKSLEILSQIASEAI